MPKPRPDAPSQTVYDPSELPPAMRDAWKRLEEENAALRERDQQLSKEASEREEYYSRRMAELTEQGSSLAKSMEQRLAEMEERFASTEKKLLSSQQSEEDSKAQLEARITAFEAAVKTNVRRSGETGELVQVNRGDAIVYHTSTGRGGLIRGGWFKCNADEQPTFDKPIVGVANQPFAYDAGVGATYHSVKFAVFKRYFSDSGRERVVGNGLPDPIIEKPVLLVPMRQQLPAHSF